MDEELRTLFYRLEALLVDLNSNIANLHQNPIPISDLVQAGTNLLEAVNQLVETNREAREQQLQIAGHLGTLTEQIRTVADKLTEVQTQPTSAIEIPVIPPAIQDEPKTEDKPPKAKGLLAAIL